MTVAAGDLGTDLDLSNDIGLRWKLVSGRRNLANAVVRRLSTPRGSMFYDLNYGYDLRGSLSRGFTTVQLGALKGDISTEVEKDERVQKCVVGTVAATTTNTLTVELRITDVTGKTFDLILSVNGVSVDLLNAGQATAIAAGAAAAVGQAVQILFITGPAGRDGADGAPGTAGPAGGSARIPLVDWRPQADSSGGEVVAYQFTAALSGIAAGTLTLDVGFRAASAAGTATFRAYVGGTFGAVDGTLVGQVTRNGPSLIGVQIAGPVTNPTGIVPVKITIQSSGLGVEASADLLDGTLG